MVVGVERSKVEIFFGKIALMEFAGLQYFPLSVLASLDGIM